jgi:outer membrane protein OmpA-like peptidoglycan-associated protein
VVKENRILLTEHVLFETNRARVNAEGQPSLAAVFNLWKQHPEWDYLIVDGYADRRGPDGFNLWLSHLRAERAIKVLVEMGFPAEKLRIRAFGHRQLRVSGDDEEADRQNRRVEFVIVKKGQAPGPDTEGLEPAAQAQTGATTP